MVNILSTRKNIRLKTPILRSDLWPYSDGYIVVKGTIDTSAAPGNQDDKAEKEVASENNPPFRSCFSKANNTFTLIENAEYLDIVMPAYNYLEYSHNYSMTSRGLWYYYRK